MKARRPVVLPLLLLLLAAGAGLHAGRPRPTAGWLRVEAPARAVAGRPLALRVTLADPPPGEWLGVDLHGASMRREPRGFVSEGGAQRVDAGTRAYAFAPLVVAGSDLGSVTAVVFLSRSGRWEDWTAVATTASIPLGSGEAGALRPLPAYERSDPAAPPPPPSLPVRLATGALWLWAALRLGHERSAGPRPERGAGRRAARPGPGTLALACAAAGLWELANLESGLAEAARALARGQRLYHERSGLQELATIALLLGAAALAARRRAPGARAPDLPAIALWLYGGISLAGLLSWHETDRLLGAAVLSVPVAQLAKLAAALVARVGSGRSRS